MKRALRDALLVVVLPILWLAFGMGVYIVSEIVEDSMGWENGSLAVLTTILIGVCAGGAAVVRIVMGVLDKNLDLWD